MTHSESEGQFGMAANSRPEIARATQVAEYFHRLPSGEQAGWGFGFGDGAISVAAQLADPASREESALSEEILDAGADIIINDPRTFTRIDPDAPDDGCGDGRETLEIYTFIPIGPGSPDTPRLERHRFKKSRRRAKVFGGGLVVASSMLRTALWGPVHASDTVLADRRKTLALLNDYGIRCGAHTDTNATGTDCGCGAIDKYPEITLKALQYRHEIQDVLHALLGGSYDDYAPAIAHVFESYQQHIGAAPTFYADAQGKKTLTLLENDGAIIKQLNGYHMEDFVVINDIEGETFDQRAFDALIRERGMAGEVQAFAIDLWRMRMYADVVAQEARNYNLDYDAAYAVALADGLVRTLATSARLTKGDQRVFMRLRPGASF